MAWPDPRQYLEAFPPFARAFGGWAIDHGTAHYYEGFSGVALWFPPGAAPDEESLARPRLRPARSKADHSFKLKAKSSIQYGFFHNKNTLRASADEVQAKDLIIWSNFQHIASIDEGLYDNFIVCQSTAGGPHASRGNSFVYHPKQKLFSIEPSPVKFIGKVHMHIVSVGLS
jgi:hypothetical protein